MPSWGLLNSSLCVPHPAPRVTHLSFIRGNLPWGVGRLGPGGGGCGLPAAGPREEAGGLCEGPGRAGGKGGQWRTGGPAVQPSQSVDWSAGPRGGSAGGRGAFLCCLKRAWAVASPCSPGCWVLMGAGVLLGAHHLGGSHVEGRAVHFLGTGGKPGLGAGGDNPRPRRLCFYPLSIQSCCQGSLGGFLAAAHPLGVWWDLYGESLSWGHGWVVSAQVVVIFHHSYPLTGGPFQSQLSSEGAGAPLLNGVRHRLPPPDHPPSAQAWEQPKWGAQEGRGPRWRS